MQLKPTATGDDISPEARLMAAQVRQRAAGIPTTDELAAMAAGALGKPGAEMSPEEIRDLAASAIDQAQKVSHLLGRLAGLLDQAGR